MRASGFSSLPGERSATGDGSRLVDAIGRAECGHLRIGIFSSLASGFLADLIATFRATHGSVPIDFFDGDPEDHVAAVRQDRLDVEFLTGTSERVGCETTLLWFERVFLVLPTGHRLTKRSEIGWVDVANERFIVSDVAPGREIQDYLTQRLSDLGRSPQIERQHVGRDNLMTLIAHGAGLTLTSEATTAVQFPGVVYRPIVGEWLPFCAVWSRQNDNPALRRLLSVAKMASSSVGHEA